MSYQENLKSLLELRRNAIASLTKYLIASIAMTLYFAYQLFDIITSKQTQYSQIWHLFVVVFLFALICILLIWGLVDYTRKYKKSFKEYEKLYGTPNNQKKDNDAIAEGESLA